jgi:hypothetical protein
MEWVRILEAIASEINFSGETVQASASMYVVFNCRMEVVHAHTQEFRINPAPSSIFLDVRHKIFFLTFLSDA